MGVTPGMGNVVIDLTGVQNSSDVVARLVAARIATVAESVTAPYLEITAISTSGSTVNLRHKRFTSFGNNPVSETVQDSNFIVSGMNSGAGGDCAMGQTCRFNIDCLSQVCNKVTKVCQ